MGTFYVQRRNINHTSGARTQSQRHDEEEEARKHRRRRCVLGMMVSLGLICVVLLIFITRQHINITAERDLFKNTAKKLKNTITSLQQNITDLKTEKQQLNNNYSSLSLEKLELDTQVKNLSAEREQLHREKQDLENRITSLRGELTEKNKQGHLCGLVCVFITKEAKSWSDSRQYCRDQGGDLVIIKSEEKQKHITSLVVDRMWIGLSDNESEGNMTWVDNSPLNQGFWYTKEPNNGNGGNEDCIELMPVNPTFNNWNDLPCSAARKAICEK